MKVTNVCLLNCMLGTHKMHACTNKHKPTHLHTRVIYIAINRSNHNVCVCVGSQRCSAHQISIKKNWRKKFNSATTWFYDDPLTLCQCNKKNLLLSWFFLFTWRIRAKLLCSVYYVCNLHHWWKIIRSMQAYLCTLVYTVQSTCSGNHVISIIII